MFSKFFTIFLKFSYNFPKLLKFFQIHLDFPESFVNSVNISLFYPEFFQFYPTFFKFFQNFTKISLIFEILRFAKNNFSKIRTTSGEVNFSTLGRILSGVLKSFSPSLPFNFSDADFHLLKKSMELKINNNNS